MGNDAGGLTGGDVLCAFLFARAASRVLHLSPQRRSLGLSVCWSASPLLSLPWLSPDSGDDLWGRHLE